ncbi:hypothetical protein F7U66_02015 [Vibrio parahaemolyticus]|nr:hypothetical protein [Vibrio parahaemolyticus]
MNNVLIASFLKRDEAYTIARDYLSDMAVEITPTIDNPDEVCLSVRQNNPIDLAYTLWSKLHDVPVENDALDQNFLHFEKGTDVFDVWHWFEETFETPIAKLSSPSREMCDEQTFKTSLKLIEQAKRLVKNLDQHCMSLQSNWNKVDNQRLLGEYFSSTDTTKDLKELLKKSTTSVSGVGIKHGTTFMGSGEYQVTISFNDVTIRLEMEHSFDNDCWVASLNDVQVTGLDKETNHQIATFIKNNDDDMLDLCFGDNTLRNTEQTTMSSEELRAINTALKSLL